MSLIYLARNKETKQIEAVFSTEEQAARAFPGKQIEVEAWFVNRPRYRHRKGQVKLWKACA